MVRITPSGARALTDWLTTPVEHIRDARSLLLLKLLFLDRRDRDSGPLLHAQRTRFESISDQLQIAIGEARGFDQTLLRWRLESAAAALRFIDTIIESPTAQGNEKLPKSQAESGRCGVGE